jgi:hypothetical protein
MLGDGHLEQVVDGMVVEPPRKVPDMLPTAIVVDQGESGAFAVAGGPSLPPHHSSAHAGYR